MSEPESVRGSRTYLFFVMKNTKILPRSSKVAKVSPVSACAGKRLYACTCVRVHVCQHEGGRVHCSRLPFQLNATCTNWSCQEKDEIEEYFGVVGLWCPLLVILIILLSNPFSEGNCALARFHSTPTFTVCFNSTENTICVLLWADKNQHCATVANGGKSEEGQKGRKTEGRNVHHTKNKRAARLHHTRT